MKSRSFIRLNVRARCLRGSDWLLLVEALWALGVARCALRMVPFKYIAAWLGPALVREKAATVLEEAAPSPDWSGMSRVSWAVQAAGKRTPWASTCLVQALAARWMLQRRGISSIVYFGIRKDNSGRLRAHAWLRSGSQVLTGALGHCQFTVVSSFAAENK